MARFLVVYGSGEGQTAKVAAYLGDVLEERGHDASVVDVTVFPDDLPVADFDAVLVGASVHGGRHQSTVRDFVDAHLDALSAKPTAFFQVSLSSASDEGREEAAGYVETFLEETGWHPDRVGQFGGALRYSKYGFLKRLVMTQIAKRAPAAEGGRTDESGDTEFTDWNDVEAFARDVAAFVEGRLGVVPPDPDVLEE